MPKLPNSGWFTGPRLQRLAIAVRTIPSSQQDIPTTESMHTLWRACGGPFDELAELLRVLQFLGLIIEVGPVTRRTAAGDRVARAIRRQDLSALGTTLVRAGVFHDQSRYLVENGASDAEGNLVCAHRTARIGASQLVGILSWWPDTRLRPEVFVPKILVRELSAVWALLPPPTEIPAWAKERKEVGNRAEMYTVQTERSTATTPSAIRWVARDADDLGWDVEDHSSPTVRRIEVKGRRDPEMIFFLSDNEWKKAQEFGDAYEIHFWGMIDLQRDPAVEYAALRQAGYPITLVNPAAEIQAGTWTAEPVRWRVRRSQTP